MLAAGAPVRAGELANPNPEVCCGAGLIRYVGLFLRVKTESNLGYLLFKVKIFHQTFSAGDESNPALHEGL